MYYINSPRGFISVSDDIISKPVKDIRNEAYIYVYKRFADENDECDNIASEPATKRTKLTADKDKKSYYVQSAHKVPVRKRDKKRAVKLSDG